jgi:cyclic pyranopterin phosphate synthase
MRLNGELRELTLATNGPQLARFAQDLADCGVRRINGLLDTRPACSSRPAANASAPKPAEIP